MTKTDDVSDKLQNKLSAARTRLILDNPFLGTLILQLPLKVASDDWCKTIATDAKYLYYNPDYIETLSLSETQFVLSHEALHCGLSHFFRRQHRNKMKWDVACDYAVNGLLKQEGLTAPRGVLYKKEFDEMAAEEIYPCIEDNDDSELQDEHIYDQENSGSSGNADGASASDIISPDKPESSNSQDVENSLPSPLSAQEKAELSNQWQKRMASAAQQAKLSGKLSESMNRIIGKLLKPKISWRQILSEYMSGLSKDDYNYSRPSSRRDGGEAHGGKNDRTSSEGSHDFIFPSLRSEQLNTVVALDTSGSVTDKELRTFVSELNAIKGQVRARITLLGCDSELAKDNIEVFEPWDEIRLPDFFIGGGGTSFDPVFDWVTNMDIKPDLLIYFTDGKAKFPKQSDFKVFFPVIWMIKGKTNPPWGKKVQLNA